MFRNSLLRIESNVRLRHNISALSMHYLLEGILALAETRELNYIQIFVDWAFEGRLTSFSLVVVVTRHHQASSTINQS